MLSNQSAMQSHKRAAQQKVSEQTNRYSAISLNSDEIYMQFFKVAE